MNYEALLDEAHQEGLIVKEKPLKYNNGRIKGKRIAIRKDIETSAEKACVLAEELGHYHTTVGDITDLSDSQNRKQERQARLWGYNKLIGLTGIIQAFRAGCHSRHETAEYLGVTEQFLQECIDCYTEKYGEYAKIDNYIIFFIPNLAVMEEV